jgi:AcrR family transcriptional regulator
MMPTTTREMTRLIAATLDEVRDVGPERLTVERIARRSGLPLDLVARLYPDISILLHDSVDQAIEDTIVRAIDDLPDGIPPAASLGLFCQRLWSALRLPVMASLYRLAHVEHDRIGTFERLLGDVVLLRARTTVRELVAEAVAAGEIRVEDAERKADRIVTLLFAHGFWHHYPELFRLFAAEPQDTVVPQILLVTLGTDARTRIMAAARGNPPEKWPG